MRRLLSIALLCAAVWRPDAALFAQDEAGDLEAVEKELSEKRKEEARLKNEARKRAQEVEALQQRMVETANAVRDAEERIAEINTQILALETEETSLKVSLAGEQKHLGDVLGALQSLERARPPAILVSPDNAAKAARAAMLLADAAPALEARARGFRDALARLDDVRNALQREREDFAKTNEQISDRRTVLADLLAQKQRERDVAARLARAAQSETAALAAKATSLRGVLGRLERFARSIAPRIKPAPARRPDAPSVAPPKPRPIRPDRSSPKVAPYKPGTPFSKAKGALNNPVVGKLMGGFRQPRPEGGRFDGLRFATADKAIVTAPFEGKVAFARAWGPIGNLIVLDVGGGYHILFIGVGVFLVEEGQTVAAGEPVAAMSGRNAMLDLEVRKDGEPVNPTLWLSRALSGDASY